MRGALFPRADEHAAASEKLEQTSFTQPALFATEYAMARLLMSWGLVPAALIGHSVGEYVAACLAGVLSPADGMALVALRGRLCESVGARAGHTVGVLGLSPLGILVGALLQQNMLYVMSKDLEVNAISIHPKARVVWKTAIGKKMQSIRLHGSRLYLGTDTGELVAMNAANGRIVNTTKISAQGVLIDYAGDDAVVLGSNNTAIEFRSPQMPRLSHAAS